MSRNAYAYIAGGAGCEDTMSSNRRAVCIGRPYVCGLAVAGEQGVYSVLRNFMADFELTKTFGLQKYSGDYGRSGCNEPDSSTSKCIFKLQDVYNGRRLLFTFHAN
jgi:hypothetical protein